MLFKQIFHKIYLYANDTCKAKYQLLLNKRESVDLSILIILKHLLNTLVKLIILMKMLMNTIQVKTQILITAMIADTLRTKKLQVTVADIFIGSRKIYISLAFITHDLILLCQKILEQTLRTLLIQKIWIKESLNKSQLIILLILPERLMKLLKKVLHVTSYPTMQLCHRIIFYELDEIS